MNNKKLFSIFSLVILLTITFGCSTFTGGNRERNQETIEEVTLTVIFDGTQTVDPIFQFTNHYGSVTSLVHGRDNFRDDQITLTENILKLSHLNEEIILFENVWTGEKTKLNHPWGSGNGYWAYLYSEFSKIGIVVSIEENEYDGSGDIWIQMAIGDGSTIFAIEFFLREADLSVNDVIITDMQNKINISLFW